MLQDALDLIGEGVCRFDAARRLVAWNAACPRWLGLAPATLHTDMAMDELFARLADDALPATLAARAPWKFSTAGLRVRGLPQADGGCLCLLGDPANDAVQTARRGSALERANADLRDAQIDGARLATALQRSEERLRLIIDNLPVQIGYFDPNQTYRYSNRRYASWFGFKESEVVGAPIPRVIGERGYQMVRHHIARALSGETVTHEYTMRQSGELVHGRSTLVPEIGPDGVVLGCFVLSFDITEQKRMQEALSQAQKMEAIGQLTGGLAHDFNNLLTIMLGNLSLLEERASDQREVADLVRPALQAAQRGAELIRRLLSFSRQQPLRPVPVDIGRLIAEMEPLIRRPLPTSIEFHSHLPEAPLHSRVDPGQLESALLNFVLNARDAMPDGGTLTIRVRSCVADELLAAEFDLAPGPYVLIEVADSGCGMDEATRARIFEPFFTTKGFGRGSGLGLAMVYGFAKQSGGGIRADGAPGHGTTLSLLLPPTPPPQAEAHGPEEALPAVASPHPLVLLVEDEAEVRQVVRNQLLDLGYPVLEAENGDQASQMLAQVTDIAILLTDVVMPGELNGRQLARQALVARPALHVVLMSGYEERDEATTAGPQPHLLGKPFSRRQLAEALQA